MNIFYFVFKISAKLLVKNESSEKFRRSAMAFGQRKMFMQQSPNTKTVELDVDLPAGIYFLQYQSKNGLFTKKIIVL